MAGKRDCAADFGRRCDNATCTHLPGKHKCLRKTAYQFSDTFGQGGAHGRSCHGGCVAWHYRRGRCNSISGSGGGGLCTSCASSSYRPRLAKGGPSTCRTACCMRRDGNRCLFV